MKIELFPPLSIHEIGKRDNQEDALWPEEATTESRLFILCDGMGGHEHGEVASRTVCLTIPHVLRRSMSFGCDDLTDEDLLGCLERTYQELDRATVDSSQKMGTTIALLYIGRKGIIALHMGDSRIYHIRPGIGILYQSRDHSLATELFQACEITYEEMLNYPKKNIVTRAMMAGKENRMHPDIIHITDIQSGDYFYLCSDGMLEQMGNRQIMSIFSSKITDEEKLRLLVDRTKDNQDNHSAWIIHVNHVIIENEDEQQPNEEITAKCNIAFILPTLEHEEKNDDVQVVKKSQSSFCKKIKSLLFNKTEMKILVFILFLTLAPSLLMAQASGGQIKRPNKKQQMTTTRKIFTISEKYAGRKYNYNIRVENGKIYWSYSGEGGKVSKSLNCNPDVNADIIIEEFKGLAYWNIANDLLFYMVEDEKIFIHDIYVGAKDAFGKCVSSLSKAKSNCPNAFKKAQGMYKDLINAENSGAKPLWEELSLLSYGMGEYPLSVCDIYDIY